jgi:GNAT superfamily N-acetyltransferase
VLKFYIETLSDCKDDASELLQLHWEQIALNKDKIKLNPDWETYQSLEDQGKVKIFTAREGSTLVGYFVVFLQRNLHYKDHVFAVNDIIFLHPDYRKGLAGMKIIKFAEKHLKDWGVSVLVMNTKTHAPFGPLLSRVGFNHSEELYTKYIGA